MFELERKLEKLENAYESKGLDVSKFLQSGISEEELKSKTDWFPSVIPEELIALYGWHNGHSCEAYNSSLPKLSFRDNEFLNIGQVKEQYFELLEYVEDITYEDFGIDLFNCFPFAAFEGSAFVIPCGKHGFDDYERPIISVFEGVDLYFYSFEKMLDTCIEWTKHPQFDQYDLPEEVELEIWKKHNPGIF